MPHGRPGRRPYCQFKGARKEVGYLNSTSFLYAGSGKALLQYRLGSAKRLIPEVIRSILELGKLQVPRGGQHVEHHIEQCILHLVQVAEFRIDRCPGNGGIP